MRGPRLTSRHRAGWLAVLALVLALGATVALVAAALGTRFGFWDFRIAFSAVRWIAYGALAAGVLGLVAFVVEFRRLGRRRTMPALAAAWVPYSAWMDLRASPPLTDITTDTADPPRFVAAAALRDAAGAQNPVTYGPEKAALQARHYPDIGPVRLALSPDAAFDKALSIVRAMGWTLVDADRAHRRIEAYETSFWFGFVDDVVIRVRAEGGGSRVDVRSSSRVGRRDAGVNAKRVRDVMAILRADADAGPSQAGEIDR